MDRLAKLALAASAAAMLVAASPIALRGVLPGLWEVSASATGEQGERRCVSDLIALAQWESRDAARCTRVILDDRKGELRARYTCANGDFGSSEIEVITPRSLRIATQGIKGGLPFNETYHARRVAACQSR